MKTYKFFWGASYYNYHPSPFTLYGVEFNCMEQYIMYMKAITFEDKDIANKILNESNPRDQKKLGRLVENFDSNKWDKVKEDIVYSGLKAKYKQNKRLLSVLLADKSDLFVEASPYDKIWGIGLSELDAKKISESEWPGLNLLGKLITKLRNELIS